MEDRLRQSILAIRALKREVESLRAGRRPPIAVLGLGCRLPGADDPAALWELLASGRDAMGDVPPERWDVDAWYDADPAAPGKSSTRRGGFLAGIDRFDAGFFEIAAREAAAMDPQQRLLLETAWEALEEGQVLPQALRGGATGVYVGINGSDYHQMAMRSPATLDAHALSGTVASVAAGRLAYVLGLEGPAMALDTACSSSLTAVHLAMQALRAGEIDHALVAGVYTVLEPHLTVALSKFRMLAPDGRCKAFDAAADGFVQGEGCVVMLLQREDDARRAGRRIHALLRGSAANQDGRTASLTAPSRKAQAAVVRAALRDAGVAPAQLGLVEAHGTGTALGDPIEFDALADALAGERAAPLVLGALKTQLGHLGPAAGIAGLLKAVLAVREGSIPPNLHLQRLNPAIDASRLAVLFPAAMTPWPAIAGPRTAGVSSFGFSGTNVHVVVQEAEGDGRAQEGFAQERLAQQARLQQPQATGGNSGAPLASEGREAGGRVVDGKAEAPFAAWDQPGAAVVLAVSGRSAAACSAARDRLLHWLERGLPLGALARSTLLGRTAFEHRIAVVASSAAQARAALAAAVPVPAQERPLPGAWWALPAGNASREAFHQLRAWSARLAAAGVPPALHGGEGAGAWVAAAAAGRLSWEAAEEGLLAGGPAPSEGLAESPADLLRQGATLLLDTGEAGAVAGLPRIALPAGGDLLPVLAQLHAAGLRPDWGGLLPPGPRAPLPLYPFQRRRHWRGPAPQPGLVLDLQRQPWLADHRVHGRVVVPGAFQLRCLAEAWAREHGEAPCRLRMLAFARPLVLPEAGALRLQATVDADGAVRLVGAAGSEVFATGEAVAAPAVEPPHASLGSLRSRIVRPLTVAAWRERLLAMGIHIGPAFGGLRALWAGTGEALGEVHLPEGLEAPAAGPCPHPALLDACLQVAGGVLGEDGAAGPLLPVGIDEVLLLRDPGRLAWAHARGGWQGEVFSSEVEVFDAAGRLCLAVRGLHVRRAPRERFEAVAAVATANAARVAGSMAAQALQPAQAVAPTRAGVAGAGVADLPVHVLAWTEAPAAAPAAVHGPVLLVLDAGARHANWLSLQWPGGRTVLLVDDAADLAEVAAATWRGPADAVARCLGGTQAVVFATTGDDPLQDAWLLAQLSRALDALPGPPRLVLATQGQWDGRGQPGGAWGMAATAALECAALDLHCVDVDQPQALLQEAAAGFPDDRVRWSGGRRSVAHLAPLALPARSAPPTPWSGTALVTGAFGGIGRHLARWAVRRGARHLLLTSRRAPGRDERAFLDALAVPYTLWRGDLAEPDAVQRLWQELPGLPPLRAVLHAAGEQAPATLATLTRAGFARAWAAKAGAAWALHEQTRGLALDAFMLCSSVASLLGAAGQGGYAPANAFLDALARHRRATGLPATSVAWGAWAGAGMAAALDAARRERIDAMGLRPMEAEAAMAALDRAFDAAPERAGDGRGSDAAPDRACEGRVSGGAADVAAIMAQAVPVIADADWQRLAQALRPGRPIAWLQAAGPSATAQPEGRPPATRSQGAPEAVDAQRQEGSAADPLAWLEQALRAVLQWPADQPWDADRPLLRLGLDSLMAVELRARIQRERGVAVSVAPLLSGASAREVAALLAPAAPPAAEWEEFKL